MKFQIFLIFSNDKKKIKIKETYLNSHKKKTGKLGSPV